MENTAQCAATMSLPRTHHPCRRRCPVELLVIWILTILVPSLPGAVRFDVFIGYDGILPEANWFPVACEVHNDGPSFKAVFELSPAQFNQGQTRLMAVDLPTG